MPGNLEDEKLTAEIAKLEAETNALKRPFSKPSNWVPIFVAAGSVLAAFGQWQFSRVASERAAAEAENKLLSSQLELQSITTTLEKTKEATAQAVRELEKAKKESDDMQASWIYYTRALSEEDPSRRIEFYNKSIASHSKNIGSFANRCVEHMNLDDLKTALEDCEMAVELANAAKNKDLMAITLNNRGQVFERTAQFDQALSDYNRALEQSPTDFNILGNRALLFAELGDFEKAIEDREAILELNPSDPFRLNELAWALIEGEIDIERGVGLANKAHSLLPNEPNIMDTLGWGYYKLEQYDKALEFLEIASKLLPGNDEVAEHYGIAKGATSAGD